jgi:signal transduction histidine kinase
MGVSVTDGLLDDVSHSLVPETALGASIVVLSPDGSIAEVSVAHRDHTREPLLRQAAETLEHSGESLLSEVVSGRTVFVRDTDSAPGTPLRSLLAAADSTSATFLPVRPSGFLVAFSPHPSGEVLRHLDYARGRIDAYLHSETLRRQERRRVDDLHHDLTQPLSAARLHLSILAGELPRLFELGAAVEGAVLCLEEMRQLLAASRTDTSGDCLASSSAIAVEVCSILSPLAREKSVQLVLNLADGGTPVAIDRVELFRVLSNVTTNAIRHSPMQSRVFITTHLGLRDVTFRVQDQGPGIAAEDAARLFDSDWLATSNIRVGSGRGLAIAREIIERQGGRISVHSRVGSGTTFTFTLLRAA